MIKNLLFFRILSKKKNKSYVPECLFIIAALVSAIFWGSSIVSPTGIIIFSLWLVVLFFLFSLAIVNLETMLLPNSLIKPLAIVVVAFQIANSIHHKDVSILWASLLGGLLLGGIPYILFQISKGKWIGGGDTKLGFVAGILLGWRAAFVCIGLMIMLLCLSFLLTKAVSKMTKNPSASRLETGIVWVLAIFLSMLIGNNLIK